MKTFANKPRNRPGTATLMLCSLVISTLWLNSDAAGQATRLTQPIADQSSLADPQSGAWVHSPDGTRYLLFSNGSHGVLLSGSVPADLRTSPDASPNMKSSQAIPPMSDEMLEAMVGDLEKIRKNHGSVVSDAFRAIAPDESSDEVFRNELMQIARDSQQEEGPAPVTSPFGNRPLPLRVNQPGYYVGMEEKLPASIQMHPSNPMPLPVTGHFSDQSYTYFGSQLPPHDAVSLRRIARTLDQAAADLEEIGRYDEADRIRKQAQELWVSGRGLHRQ